MSLRYRGFWYKSREGAALSPPFAFDINIQRQQNQYELKINMISFLAVSLAIAAASALPHAKRNNNGEITGILSLLPALARN